MAEFWNLLLNAEDLLQQIFTEYGSWTYLIVFAIIFIETGLVVVTFFPGDGLLFSLGIFAATGDLSLSILFVLLICATFLGNTSNYYIGRTTGNRFISKLTTKRNQYLLKAKEHYERYGKSAIIWSRLFPVFRSLVPFVAGIAKMDIIPFTWCNLIGAILWISTYLLLGYFFGEIPWVKKNTGLIFAILLGTVILVVLFNLLKGLFKKYFLKKLGE